MGKPQENFLNFYSWNCCKCIKLAHIWELMYLLILFSLHSYQGGGGVGAVTPGPSPSYGNKHWYFLPNNLLLAIQWCIGPLMDRDSRVRLTMQWNILKNNFLKAVASLKISFRQFYQTYIMFISFPTCHLSPYIFYITHSISIYTSQSNVKKFYIHWAKTKLFVQHIISKYVLSSHSLFINLQTNVSKLASNSLLENFKYLTINNNYINLY